MGWVVMDGGKVDLLGALTADVIRAQELRDWFVSAGWMIFDDRKVELLRVFTLGMMVGVGARSMKPSKEILHISSSAPKSMSSMLSFQAQLELAMAAKCACKSSIRMITVIGLSALLIVVQIN